MDNINREYIDRYIKKLTKKEISSLEEFRKSCEIRRLPIIYREVGQLIRLFISMTHAKNIIEIGTNAGYSSIFMAHAMGEGGRVLTFERSELFYKEAKRNIEEFGLEDSIDIRLGDAAELLKSTEGHFDMAFIDAAKSHYTTFFNSCIELMSSGGVIISDNVLYQGMIATDDLVVRRKKTLVRNLREYLSYITYDERFETSVLPLGDGVAVTYIK